MTRRLNRPVFDKWLEEHKPDGISQLAVESKVSADTIRKARATGLAPKKPITLEALCKAMGHDMDTLFPKKEQAS